MSEEHWAALIDEKNLWKSRADYLQATLEDCRSGTAYSIAMKRVREVEAENTLLKKRVQTALEFLNKYDTDDWTVESGYFRNASENAVEALTGVRDDIPV